MRLLRLAVVPFILIVVSLSVAPAHAVDRDDPDAGGFLGQLLGGVLGSTSDPTPSSPAPSSDRPSVESTESSPTVGSSEGDVSASAQIAVDDDYTVPANQSTQLTPNVADNDSGEAAIYYVVTPPAHGTVAPTTQANHTYTPNPGYTGPDSFQYSFQGAVSGSSNTATVTLTVVGPDVVDVEADCSGEVTFTNLLSEEVNVRYGPGDSLEGEFDLPADQSETITTNSDAINYLAANASNSEQGSIEIPSCSDDVVDVEADCSGDVTFTNPNTDAVYVVFGDFPPSETGSADGQILIAGGQSETITTALTFLDYEVYPASSNDGFIERGSIEIPSCSNDDDDDDGDGDGDESSDGDDGDSDSSNLPDTGAPSSDLLALGLTLAFLGSLLLVRPGGLRRLSTRV